MRTANSGSRVRDASLDNAKAILIVLVVLGHVIEDVPKDDFIDGVYRVIYLFHMPAFALITGYLSRRFKASVSSYLKLLGAVVVPYVIFQVAHAVIDGWLDEKPIKVDLLHTEWTMWYLVAVAFWRILTPILRAIPFAVPVSFLIALGYGLVPDLPAVLALDRTITLLPFFVIGLASTPEGLDRIRRFGAVPLGVIFVPVAVAAVWSTFDQLSGSDFWFSRSFVQLGDDDLVTGLQLRLGSYALGLLGTAWVLAMASRRKLPLTYIGVNSMYVYLLHSVVLTRFRDDGVIEGLEHRMLLAVSIVFSVALAAVLASKPVTMLTRLAVQPPFSAIGAAKKKAAAKESPDSAPAAARPEPQAEHHPAATSPAPGPDWSTEQLASQSERWESDYDWDEPVWTPDTSTDAGSAPARRARIDDDPATVRSSGSTPRRAAETVSAG